MSELELLRMFAAGAARWSERLAALPERSLVVWRARQLLAEVAYFERAASRAAKFDAVGSVSLQATP